MQVKPKTVVQMKLSGEATSHSRTDVSVRDVEVTIDENFASTPVAGGEALCWSSYSFSATVQ